MKDIFVSRFPPRRRGRAPADERGFHVFYLGTLSPSSPPCLEADDSLLPCRCFVPSNSGAFWSLFVAVDASAAHIWPRRLSSMRQYADDALIFLYKQIKSLSGYFCSRCSCRRLFNKSCSENTNHINQPHHEIPKCSRKIKVLPCSTPRMMSLRDSAELILDQLSRVLEQGGRLRSKNTPSLFMCRLGQKKQNRHHMNQNEIFL